MRNILNIAMLALACSACTDGAHKSENHSDAHTEQSEGEQANAKLLETLVIKDKTSKVTQEEWGTFKEYFSGDTEGFQNLLSGTATIKPGLEIHPPHKHAEEEFLMVLEGTGTWTIGDKDFEANKGDMLYAAAWDLHGIKNTGDTPLTFVFWKQNSKGIPIPIDPAE